MNTFKKFINKKKVQSHFKKSGEGVRLDSGAGGSSSSQPSITTGSAQGANFDRIAAADVAAQAALKRMSKNEPQQDASKKKIQMIAKRELEKEEEDRKKMEQMSLSDKPQQDIREFEHSSAITNVHYTSELLGEDNVKTKPELLKDIENFLNEQVSSEDDDEDKMVAAVLMLYSLNKTAIRDTAIETICKYIQNILEHPGEAKYRSIRIGNKAFQERVQAAIGGRKFLESVGFVEKQEGEDAFFVFSRESDLHLIDAIETLRNGQAVPIKVARNLEIFSITEGQKIITPKLADDFFNLSAEELKQEQKSREQQVERMFALRTKEMKKKDEQLRNYRYKYTLIRVRLPGNLLLQGVFSCHEQFSTVRAFVASALNNDLSTVEFSLRDAAGQNVDDENLTLANYGLAPAAVLHLVFDQPIESQLIIKEELIDIVQQL